MDKTTSSFDPPVIVVGDLTTAPTSPTLSNSSTATAVCRICYAANGRLYAFCQCKGSIGFFHRKCLQRWIRINSDKAAMGDAPAAADDEENTAGLYEQAISQCEICHDEFKGVRRALKPLRKWRLPSFSLLDPMYLSIFMSCALLLAYSAMLITRNFDRLFLDGEIPSAAIYLVTLNILFLAFSLLAWRRAIGLFVKRFFEMNVTWCVRITADVIPASDLLALNGSPPHFNCAAENDGSSSNNKFPLPLPTVANRVHQQNQLPPSSTLSVKATAY